MNETKSHAANRIATITIVAAIAAFVCVLPAEIRLGLLLWSLASVPIGVLIGHCVLPGD
ncbi:MAG TPA: hypothetical protein VFG12_10285 [Rhodopila sp.]|nr:hypothetical protein [Rhodopila sp.]